MIQFPLWFLKNLSLVFPPIDYIYIFFNNIISVILILLLIMLQSNKDMLA